MFDSKAMLDDTLTVDDVIDSVLNEYGESRYGQVKYDKEVLYWIGYIYRYFSYTYELSSKQVYKVIKPKELRMIYRGYHSLDPAQAIERILEAKHISYTTESYTVRGVEILRRLHNQERKMR